METTYTFIAYKPNGESWCRGHVVDRHDSAFIFEAGLSKDAAIERWVELLGLEWEKPDWDMYWEIYTIPELGAALEQINFKANQIQEEKRKHSEKLIAAAQLRAKRERESQERKEFERLKTKFKE